MIYFVQAVDGGPIKIGTTVQLKVRLSGLKSSRGQSLRVLAVLEGRRDEEKELHRRFAHLRQEGEWFAPGEELLAFIASEGREWDATDRREVGSIRLPVDLAYMLNVVAAIQDCTSLQIVDKLLRPSLEREHRETVAKAAKALERRKPTD